MAEAAPIVAALKAIFKAGMALDAMKTAVEVSDENKRVFARLDSLLNQVQHYLERKQDLQGPELRGHGDTWLEAMLFVSDDLKAIDTEVTKLGKALNPKKRRDRALKLLRASETSDRLQACYGQLQHNYSQLIALDMHDSVQQANADHRRETENLAAKIDGLDVNFEQKLDQKLDQKFDQFGKCISQLMRYPSQGLAAVETLVTAEDEDVSPNVFKRRIEHTASSSSATVGSESAPVDPSGGGANIEPEYEAQRRKIGQLRPLVADFLQRLERGKIGTHLTPGEREGVAILIDQLWMPWNLDRSTIEFDTGANYEPVQLGVGGFGTVSRGTLRVKQSKFKVALKTMHSDIDWEHHQSDFFREVSLRSRLRHPTIVRFYGACWPGDWRVDTVGVASASESESTDSDSKDSSEDEGEIATPEKPILVMEYMNGDVGSLFKTGKLRDDIDLVRIFYDISDALVYMHQERVIHNDIKPENVLAMTSGGSLVGRAKLTDFGVSVQRQSTVSARNASKRGAEGMAGTVAFMAPEVLLRRTGGPAMNPDSGESSAVSHSGTSNSSSGHQSVLSFASDVYSVGVTMCSLLFQQALKAGREVKGPLFLARGDIGLGVFAQEGSLAKEMRDWAAEVIREESCFGIRPIILACLNDNPRDRPSILSIRDELERILSGERCSHDLCRIGTAACDNTDAASAIALSDTESSRGNSDTLSVTAVLDDDTFSSSLDSDIPEEPAELAQLARKLESGKKMERKELKALQCHKRAAGGNLEAMAALGKMLQEGRGLPKNVPLAVSWYKRAAEGGCVSAMFSLARTLEKGREIPLDDQGAVLWYERAGTQGHVKAMNNLALKLRHGKGITKDEQRAFFWFQRAAEGGNEEAMITLANILEDGQGVQRNPHQAAIWLERAAERGNPKSMCKLAERLGSGKGVKQNDEKAVEWLQRAAEKGYVRAMYRLALMMRNGRGTARDYREALSWFERAATEGYVRAMVGLGDMLGGGRGVPRDDQSAVSWYERAAESGNLEAMVHMAVHLENGTGIARDGGRAFGWYERAAIGGNLEAMFRLGVSLAKGILVPRDCQKAVIWYERAAEKGHVAAMCNLDLILDMGDGVEKDRKQAFAWCSRAAKEGDVYAMKTLGEKYDRGLGVQVNHEKAQFWHNLASSSYSLGAVLGGKGKGAHL